jgi:uncharacterized membrane protein YkgB
MRLAHISYAFPNRRFSPAFGKIPKSAGRFVAKPLILLANHLLIFDYSHAKTPIFSLLSH